MTVMRRGEGDKELCVIESHNIDTGAVMKEHMIGELRGGPRDGFALLVRK